MTTEDETTKIRNVPMATLVFGAPVPKPETPRRNWLWAAATIGAALWGFSCATLRTPVAAPVVESVGALSESATHVYTAPVHPDTDLSVAFQPAGADADDDAEPMKVAAKADAAPTDDAPTVAPKEAHGF